MKTVRTTIIGLFIVFSWFLGNAAADNHYFFNNYLNIIRSYFRPVKSDFSAISLGMGPMQVALAQHSRLFKTSPFPIKTASTFLQQLMSQGDGLQNNGIKIRYGNFKGEKINGNAIYVFVDNRLAAFEIHSPMKWDSDGDTSFKAMQRLIGGHYYNYRSGGGFKFPYGSVSKTAKGAFHEYDVHWNEKGLIELFTWQSFDSELECAVIAISPNNRAELEPLLGKSLELFMPLNEIKGKSIFLDKGSINLNIFPRAVETDEVWLPSWAFPLKHQNAGVMGGIYNALGGAQINVCISIPNVACQQVLVPPSGLLMLDMTFEVPLGYKGTIEMKAHVTHQGKTQLISNSYEWR